MRLTTAEAADRYQNTLFRIAFHICRCEADAEDAVQECFLRYHSANAEYADEEHLKAWLIRVTINQAKNIANFFWRRNRENWEETMAEISFEAPENSALFSAVMVLPRKYRIVIHL